MRFETTSTVTNEAEAVGCKDKPDIRLAASILAGMGVMDNEPDAAKLAEGARLGSEMLGRERVRNLFGSDTAASAASILRSERMPDELLDCARRQAGLLCTRECLNIPSQRQVPPG